ncbi:NAD(P)H-dependent flavin oxidoreductase [Nesterenkonia alba]|uniref:NAD(P)H-dependent flavin oxidoreductase n=1 Tax=Nesterenkonia alba TaxID=515814 RepID=UPI00146BA0B7|nr:nitronate monooxygenase [Nesterenkonia alba]
MIGSIAASTVNEDERFVTDVSVTTGTRHAVGTCELTGKNDIVTDEEMALNLTRPLVLAPMAGGPSTPRLAAEVAEAGGLPFLAAGYLSPEKLGEDIVELESRISKPYGINLFVPDHQGQDCDRDAYESYRQQIATTLDIPESLLPAEPVWSDDYFEAKLGVALESSARFVSFTFGHPSAAVIERVHAAGKLAVLYATSRPGLNAVAASGADVIGIQGANAGGHRATVFGVDDDSAEPLVSLIEYALSISDKPVFAGGGIATSADVLEVLRAGATAVQVGTLFLDAEEAGTKETHRWALRNLKDRDTVVTRAFTGRPARAISNRFTDTLSDAAPALYPQLHYLTSGLRKKAAEGEDAESLNLWAGTGFPHASSKSAGRIVRELFPYHPSANGSKRA